MSSDFRDLPAEAAAAAPSLRKAAEATGVALASELADAAGTATSLSQLAAVGQAAAAASSQVSTAAPTPALGAGASAGGFDALDLGIPTEFEADDFAGLGLSGMLAQLHHVGEDVLGSGTDMLGIGSDLLKGTASSAMNSPMPGAAGKIPSLPGPGFPDGGASFMDDVEGLDAQVKIGSFSIKRKSGRQTSAEIAFWPKGKSVAMPKLRGILEKDWKLPRPNLSVFIDAGTAHPLMLSTELLRNLPQFKDWLKHAGTQMDLSRKRNDASSPSNSPSIAADASIIDRLIFEKLVNVISAVLDAAEKTHNYIVVDRTNGSSGTSELLLELALQQTDARPTVLVIECRDRLRAYHGEESALQLAQIEEIERRCVLHGTDGIRKRTELTALYMPQDFEDPDVIRDQAYSDMPLPRRPDKDHIIDGGLEVLIAGEDGASCCLNPKRLWFYHYSQYMFSSGTHYIFLEDPDQVFRADALGPVGGIFAHGGTLAQKRMRDWLQLGKPSVMLFNTGGATQAFASLHSIVVRGQVQDMGSILRAVQITSGEKWASTFGISDIVMMQELKKRAPLVIQKAIVSVDILRDSAEDVLHIVTGCFANAAGQLPELGLRSAEDDVVLRAWSQHLILFSSATSYRRLADFYFFISIFLLFLTAAASMLREEVTVRFPAGEGLWGWNYTKELDETLRWIIVIVPIVSGVVATIMQRKRALQKWSVLYTASMQIVAEIYKFRARVLEYDVPALPHEEEQPGQDVEHSKVMGHGAMARHTRMKFVHCIQRIFSGVLNGDMSKDALSVRGVSRKGQDELITHKDLRNHVERNLLRHRFRKKRKLSKVSPEHLGVKQKKGAVEDVMTTVDIFDDVEEDDLRSPISIEAYMQRRMKPLLMHYSKQAPKLSRRLSILEYSMMLLDGTVVILALPGDLNHWVSFAVTIRVLIMNIIQYTAYSPQLGSLNNGVRDLQNLVTWWDSLSVIDRRTRSAKLRAVSTVEQVMLNHASSKTAEIANIVSASNIVDQGMETNSEETNSPNTLLRSKRGE